MLASDPEPSLVVEFASTSDATAVVVFASDPGSVVESEPEEEGVVLAVASVVPEDSESAVVVEESLVVPETVVDASSEPPVVVELGGSVVSEASVALVELDGVVEVKLSFKAEVLVDPGSSVEPEASSESKVPLEPVLPVELLLVDVVGSAKENNEDDFLQELQM